jgi:hypothetical protein
LKVDCKYLCLEGVRIRFMRFFAFDLLPTGRTTTTTTRSSLFVLLVACCLAERCLAERCSSCRIARTVREQNIAILSAVGDVSRSPMIKSALCTLTPAQAWVVIFRRSGRSLVPLMPLTRSFHGSASVPSDDADAGANTLLMKQHMHSLKVSYHTGVLCVCVIVCLCLCARVCRKRALFLNGSLVLVLLLFLFRLPAFPIL